MYGMMWIGLLLALAISAVALFYVVWPLLKPGPAPVMVEDDRLAELLGRKDAVMKSIKDLEFDYRVGKLSEEDYQLYDQRLRRQAIGLLQQIEQAAPESAQLDAAVEDEIAQRRKVSDRPVVALPAIAVPAAAVVTPALAPPRPTASGPGAGRPGCRYSGTSCAGAVLHQLRQRAGAKAQVLRELRVARRGVGVSNDFTFFQAPQAGIEPATLRLEGGCSIH